MRTYKPKPKDRDPDRRMAITARLRAEGLSYRQIAAQQLCSYQTVARDLSRWALERDRMPLEIIRLSHPSPRAVTRNAPGAIDVTPPRDSGANVIPLRRTA